MTTSLFYYHCEEVDGGEDIITKDVLPAIIAKIYGFDGSLVGFHRIYLDEVSGSKAKVPEAKMLISPLYKDGYSTQGCVVPLAKAGEVIGICEGIETALAINEMGHPCWSLIDAYKLPNFNPPKGVKVINAFGDLDKSYTGQNQLIKLFDNLREKRPEIQVNLHLPPSNYWDKAKNPKGIDFLDAYLMGYRLPNDLVLRNKESIC